MGGDKVASPVACLKKTSLETRRVAPTARAALSVPHADAPFAPLTRGQRRSTVRDEQRLAGIDPAGVPQSRPAVGASDFDLICRLQPAFDLCLGPPGKPRSV